MNADVVHIITGLDVGGAERSLTNLITHGLSGELAHAVISLTSEGVFGAPIRDAGVPVYSLGMRRGVPSPVGAWRLRKLVAELKPRVLQGWMYHGNLAASVICRTIPVKPCLVWNIRQSLYDIRTEKILTRWIVRRHVSLSAQVDGIIYNSEVARRQHETLGIESGQARVLVNGFDVERFRPDQQRRVSLRQKLGIPQGAIVIGHAGRFHPMKNHRGFLRATARLSSGNPDLHIVLCGPDITPGNSALRALADELDHSRVHLIGEQPKMEDLLPAFDLLCSSSSWGEGFPNVVGEAMACGVPCVVTDVGDSSRLVSDCGTVVPPLDEETLIIALAEMASLSHETRTGLGDRARKLVADRYSIDSAVMAYQSLYREMLMVEDADL
ncbi:MAG: glycosyltransferase [Gammaproteobacteria bacterium]|nr:glycosyltransferase [Gammaproteobacteria bacterium]